jgi:Tol biopolymer transport system component
MPRVATLVLAASALAAAVAGSSAATGGAPAGGTIMFASNRAENVTPRLYAADAASGRRRTLTQRGLQPTGISVSNSGRFVAFFDSPPSGGGGSAYVVGSGGRGLHRLTPRARGTGQAVWSHDDRRLVLTVGSPYTGMLLVRRDGSGLHRLAPRASDPAWSPDDTRIAYDSDNRVRVVTAGGRLLWSVPGYGPRWSASGNYVSVVHGWRRGSGMTVIEIVNGHGRIVRRLRGHDPAWAPHGDRIAFVRDDRVYTGSMPRGRAAGIARGSGPYAAPSWSPSGKRIAYQSLDGHVVVVSSTGGRAARVGRGLLIGWSPDATRIAFANRQLFVVSSTGRGRRQVTHEPAGSELSASWAGAHRLVYTSLHYYNDYELYRMSGDGGTAHPLTHDRISEGDPARSPDGKLLAFTRADEPSDSCRPCGTSIWTVDPEGKAVQITKPPSTDDIYFDRRPSWSPNGGELVFVRATAVGAQLMIVRADGSHLRALTAASASQSYPTDATWGRDGRIAFEMVDAGSEAIFVVEPDGSRLTRLATSPQGAFAPSWSPDGSRLAFVAAGGISIVAATGAAQGTIAVPGLLLSAENGIALSWSPDATRIAYDLDGRVYSIGLDGTGRKLLAEGISPNWR